MNGHHNTPFWQILSPSDPCTTPTCAAALQLRWTAYPYRHLHTSIIIPSGYAVLCSSDASQLSSLHQPRIHPRSISERCSFSPIFPLAILKVVLLASSSGWLHHLYSPWIILSRLTSSDGLLSSVCPTDYSEWTYICSNDQVYISRWTWLTLFNIIPFSSPPFLLDFAGSDVDVGPAVPSDVDRHSAGGLP